MNELLGLRRFQSRPGYRLALVTEIAVPVYTVNVTILTLAHKRVPPIEEFILRCLAMGMTDRGDICSFLGLQDEVVRPALTVLAQTEHVALAGEGRENKWCLTPAGKKTLESSLLIVPEERTVPVIFDAVLRKPISLRIGGLLERKEFEAAGMTELALQAPRRPSPPEFTVADINRVLKKSTVHEQEKRDVLCIRSVDARSIKKRFVSAYGLFFVSANTDDVQLAFVLNGQLSPEHETKFASMPEHRQLIEQFRSNMAESATALDLVFAEAGVTREQLIGNSEVRTQISQAEAEVETRERLLETVDEDGETASLKAEIEKLKKEIEELHKAYAAQGPTLLYMLDHPRLLKDALVSAKNRIVIISPWIKPNVVDAEFSKLLEAALRRGVRVHIGYGYSGDVDTVPIEFNRALKTLRAIEQRHKNLKLMRWGDTHAKVLIKDTEFAAITSFNWLSFAGDPKRKFRDEQGVLLRAPDLIEKKFSDLMVRFNKQ